MAEVRPGRAGRARLAGRGPDGRGVVGMKQDDAARDLIEEYLDGLRRGLRARSGEADLILAEAEDHLRETEAAGIAVGMTKREAQEAAISSFGSVGAVTRAHLARLARGSAALAGAAMAAWKLVSLLLVVAGTGAMAAIVLSGTRMWQPIGAVRVFPADRVARQITSYHLAFN